ncbi:MAG: DUF2500 domain-containing protein [Oscillospiraceae bacterium]|jgi:hypothetical protein|nr:DUF2500 domain-containing protein [Oscillospiraceae bacterium]
MDIVTFILIIIVSILWVVIFKNGEFKYPCIPANAKITQMRMSNTDSALAYRAEFEFDTGDRYWYTVNEFFYHNYTEGQTGLLIAKGKKFVSFDCNNHINYEYPILFDVNLYPFLNKSNLNKQEETE